MKLYHISQVQNRGYDTYDSAVVAAPNEETARNMHPSDGKPVTWGNPNYTWCEAPEFVSVRCIADKTTEPLGVVCASFNAG